MRIQCFASCLLLAACGGGSDGDDAGVGVDSAVLDAGGGGVDAGPDDDAGPGDDAGGDVDSGGMDDAGADAAVGLDGGAATVTHVGVVSVGDTTGAGFVGSIRGAFVIESEVSLLSGVRVAIFGAPDCYEVLPPPPVAPMYLDAGTLSFTGLVLASHTLAPNVDLDYSFEYAGLLETPGSPIALTVPGAASIEAMAGTVNTPDPAVVGTWSLGSTGSPVSWTAGNGDFVVLSFGTASAQHQCVVPDTGSFLVPAQALDPSGEPAGGTFVFERVIESVTRSASGTNELRFRAFTRDTIRML